jgi:hypothetical protein
VAVLAASLIGAGCSALGAGRVSSPTTIVITKAAHSLPATTTTTPEPATFSGPDGVEARWVIDENNKAGTTAWHLDGDGGAAINGFANLTAAYEGQKVTLYVTTSAARSGARGR